MSIGFLRHIQKCTNHNPEIFVPFLIGGKAIGSMRRDFMSLVSSIEGFIVTDESVCLTPIPDTVETRTQALQKATALLCNHHHIPQTSEIYPISENWGDTPLALIERAAIPWFGTLGCGVHANGFVRKVDGIYIWVARRAADRKIDPGKLDNMIGGGLPIGYTIEENLRKEAWEEAGLPPPLSSNAKMVQALHYQCDMMKGVRNDTLFVFDIDLPESFEPQNTDGEVESFTLMPAKEVAHIIETTDDFKFNCNLVIIDFLLRYDLIPHAHHEYEALVKAISTIRT